MTKPKSLLDPNFVYVPAAETNLRKTFARVRRELAKERAVERDKVVTPITGRKQK